jgi:hypothetical protein
MVVDVVVVAAVVVEDGKKGRSPRCTRSLRGDVGDVVWPGKRWKRRA